MPAPFTYVVEHMESDEADGSFPPWVSLEYTQMLKLAAAPPPPFASSSSPTTPTQATVIFSSLSTTSTTSLSSLLSSPSHPSSSSTPKATFQTTSSPILTLLSSTTPSIPFSRVCLLDPKAPKVLSPSDANEFDLFLFGGILGDDPPRDRTGELRRLGFEGRHLGEVQMTTDTALGVTKLVVQDQIPLDKIPFLNHPTIVFSPQESVEMPFRYVDDGTGNPVLPEGMRELLRDDMDKGFEGEGEEF